MCFFVRKCFDRSFTDLLAPFCLIFSVYFYLYPNHTYRFAVNLFSKCQAEGRKRRKKTKSGGKNVSSNKNFVKNLFRSQVENVVVFQKIPGRLSK